MFKLVSKIYNGNIQIGYEVLDESNKSRIITIENAQGLAMMNGIENVVFNNRTRSLNGTNGNDLRTLPRKQQKVTKQNSSEYSNIFYGKELANILTTENYKERWIMQDLMKFWKIHVMEKYVHYMVCDVQVKLQ